MHIDNIHLASLPTCECCANVGARRIPAAKTAESKLVMVAAWLLVYLVAISCCPMAASKRKFCCACRIYMDELISKDKLTCAKFVSIFLDALLWSCITTDAWSAIPSSVFSFLVSLSEAKSCKWLEHVPAKTWNKNCSTIFLTFEVLMKVEQLKQHLSRACPTRLGTKPRAVFVCCVMLCQVTEYGTFVKFEPSRLGLPWSDRRAPRNSCDPGCELLLSYLQGLRTVMKNVRICWGDVWLSHHVILGRRVKSHFTYFTCGSSCSTRVVLVCFFYRTV